MKYFFSLLILFTLFFSCEKKQESISKTGRKGSPNKDSIVPMQPADSAKLEEYTNDNKNEPYSYVLVEWCKVYEDTSMKKAVASLPFGTAVRIIGYEDVTSKITEKWQHKITVIRFLNGKDTSAGYTYETNLSFFAARASDGNLILSGFDHFATEPLTAKILVVDSLNRVIEKTSFPIIGDYDTDKNGARIFSYYTEGRIISDHKASGFNDLISLYVYYPACGYLSQEYFYNYHKKRLQAIAICDHLSDAGIFNSRSYLIFPEEPQGKPNSILKVQRTIEYEINDEGNMNVLDEDSSLVQLHWDMNKGVMKSDTLFNNFDQE